ncbi:FAD-dependent oxidoreductase [Streptomyces sp. NPDC001312]|uniref:FAD-dependent oxidoreductase n=1 Tax=Streptomyces sp. NPDC001312 TaxID=3364561 RepID=UPI0036BA1608
MTRIIVIGGGIGGLCLGQGLRRAGIDVAVYERDTTPDARLQGYRLNIEPVGSRALQACLPEDLWHTLIATSGDPSRGMGVFTERLHELMREDDVLAPDPAEATHAVSRITLRRLLLHGLDDIVEFDKEFVGYEQLPDGRVVASFADGSTATGDLLVGADGSRSRVRRQFLPDARTTDAPGVGIGGKLPLTEANLAWLPPELLSGKNMILPKRDFLFTAVFRRRETETEPVDEDYLMWAHVSHRDALCATLNSGSGPDLRSAVASRTADWHPDLRRVITDTPAATVQRFDFAAARKPKHWDTTNVTLLGDAIHFMPPVGGLGGNAALHDAHLLREALVRVRSGELALSVAVREYESRMLVDGFASVRTALRYLTLATARSRALRGTARGFFRTCGAIGPLRRAVFAD